MGLHPKGRIGHQAGGQVGETALVTLGVTAVVTVDLHRLQLAFGVIVPLQTRLFAFPHHPIRATVEAAHRVIGHFFPVAENHSLHLHEPWQGLERRRGHHPRRGRQRLQIYHRHLFFRRQPSASLQFHQQSLHWASNWATNQLSRGRKLSAVK
jgi:hypothetical protein